jgi:hypothetical protein
MHLIEVKGSPARVAMHMLFAFGFLPEKQMRAMVLPAPRAPLQMQPQAGP